MINYYSKKKVNKPLPLRRKLFFKLIRYTGLPALFRRFYQRRRVTILVFHDIDPRKAEPVFAFLKRNYNLISLKTFIRACQNKKAEDLPARPLVITFDDGHVGNFSLLPLIKRYQLPITIFLCAGIVGTNRHFWFTHSDSILSDVDLKKVPNQERLAHLEAIGFFPEKEYARPQALNREQIMAMKETVDFQAHTLFHPCLPNCDDAEAWGEIRDSRKVLEEKFGLDIEGFAYPNGDYTYREMALCKKAGFKYALTVDSGLNSINSDLFRLKRISVNEGECFQEMVVKSSGLWSFFKGRRAKVP